MALTKNPKLALIPSGYKASKVYSVLPSDGVGDFDFSRSGNATRIDKDGLIETVASNVPRLNYPLSDGVVSGCPSLLLEPESRNLVQYSEDLSNFTQTNTSTTDNVAISPSGILNASKTVPNTSNTFHWIGESYSVSSSVYTQSIFAKADTYSHLFMILRTDGGVNRYAVKIDLSNGTIVNDLTLGTPTNTSYKIENYGNGWYRCSISSNHSSGSVLPLYSASVGGALTSISNEFQGDGTSGIYIWGAMLEQGSYPTSYIPTNGEVNGVTRSAETCNNSGDANTFNDSEGVLMAEISALNNTVDGFKTINIGSNSVDNRLGFGFDDQSRIYGFKRTTTSWNIPIEANINEFNKVAISYDTNNNHFWFNGFKVGSNTTIGDIAQPIELDFRASYGGEQFNGSTKQIQYFDTVLTDTDLEELTSWQSFNEMAESQQYTIL